MSSHPIDFTGETEDTLLGYMAMQRDDPEIARAAWHELYTRHHRYLLAVIGRTYSRDLGGDEEVVAVAIEAFQDLFEWAGRQLDPDNVIARFAKPTPDRTRQAVLGYLTKIAKNRVMERFRGAEGGPPASQLEDEAWDREWQKRSENPVPRLSPEVLALHARALEILGERDAEVLRLSLLWYDPDKGEDGEFCFPPGEAERVANSMGTTPENFRQLRSRALRRVRAALEREGLAPAARGETQ